MALTTTDTKTRSGLHAEPGAAGDAGTLPGVDGGVGSDGLSGGAAVLQVAGSNWTSGTALDLISIARISIGGQGGVGGQGGNGAAAGYSSTQSTEGSTTTTTTTYGDAGHGGTGGAGGRGGAAKVTYDSLTLALGSTDGVVQDQANLEAIAMGGNGGGGGAGGTGGNSSGSGTWNTFSGTILREASTSFGGAGGDGGDGGAGGIGGAATARFQDIAATGDDLSLHLKGLAVGGAGGVADPAGSAVSGQGMGGWGATAGAAGTGDAAGAGGVALAEVQRLSVSGGSHVTLMIEISAKGGSGGNGDALNRQGYGETYDLSYQGSQYDSGFIERVAGLAAQGPAGGDGGNATARLQNSTVSLSTQADSVSILLRAVGGEGGHGGTGTPEILDGCNGALTFIGAPAGVPGQDGQDGVACIALSLTSIALGGGDDTLALTLAFGGARRKLLFSGNSFDGGAGFDTALLGQADPDAAGVTVDVAGGSIRIGNAPKNAFIGFERILGGFGADSIKDGTGDQTYAGGAGADSFSFTRRHGADIVVDADTAQGDSIILRNFGPALDSFADVLALATDGPAGVVIATPFGGSITLSNHSVASLTADLFLFA